MEKRRYSLLISLLLFVLLPLAAQWDNPPGQYWVVNNMLNPSLAGKTEAISTSLLYRYAWAGIKNAPQQTIITIDMPFEFFGRRHGVGVIANRLSVDERHNSLIAAQYSYKKAIQQGSLGIGLQAGIYDLHFDAASIHIGDNLQPTNVRKINIQPTAKRTIDFNAGISWTDKNLLFALSVIHIGQPKFYIPGDTLSSQSSPTIIQPDSVRSSIPRTYNLMLAYNITFFHPFEIKPMLWLQSDPHSFQLQATLRLEYNQRFSSGVAWRKKDGYLFFAGTFFRGAELGYAYSHHNSGIGTSSRGSHELYIRYDFPIDYFKPKRTPHKSIRIL